MKKKLFLTAILTLLCCTLLIAGASATSDTPMGAGTKDDPYKLSNADHLKWFANLVNNSSEGADNTGACAELTCDINLGGSAWTPIGGYIYAYTGTFDGNGHTIFGLNYSDSDGCAGLFGYVGDGGTITGCDSTENCKVTATDRNAVAGGVCGYNNGGTIIHSTNSGTVNGETAGGVCGYNENLGTIQSCTNTVAVTGSGYTGGVCGHSASGRISLCTNTGAVNGGGDTGGVCGYNGGAVDTSINSGTVNSSGDTSSTGGVCGYNVETIENCYNTGTVTGYYAGGVCGYNNGGTITNCYWLKEEGKPSSGIGSGNADGATIKSTEQFASGEVTWLLNHGQNNGPWRQNVDNGQTPDNFPTLVSNRGEVVKLTVDGAVSYHNSPYVFEGVDGKTYFDETGKRIDLPYTVKKDTILTSKTLVTVTADSFDLFVGDAAPTLTCTISPAVEMEGIELKCDANMYTPGVYPITVTGPASDDLHVYTYVTGS